MICFHMPASLYGRVLYLDTNLWPCSFVPPFHETKFCGVPSCVFDKLGCAAGERRLRNTALGHSAVQLQKFVLHKSRDHITKRKRNKC
jgi:hypothetical protein